VRDGRLRLRALPPALQGRPLPGAHRHDRPAQAGPARAHLRLLPRDRLDRHLAAADRPALLRQRLQRVPAEAVLHAAPPRARRGGDDRRRRAASGPHVGRGAAVVPGDRRRGAVPRGLRLERLLRAPPLHARQARATAAVRRHPAVQLHLLAAAAPAPGHGAAGHDRARGAVPPHAAFVHARHRHHGRGEVSVADDPHAADAPAGGRARGAVAPAAGRRPAWTAAPAPGEPFVLGVNYWPRRKAMWWWRGFDDAEVDEELALVASLGLELVRVFLLWDDFQPAPDTVSRERLAELERLCDLAERHGLGL